MSPSDNIACPWMELTAKGSAGNIADRQFVYTDDEASRDNFIRTNKGKTVHRSVACVDDPKTQIGRIAPLYFIVKINDPEETRQKALELGFRK